MLPNWYNNYKELVENSIKKYLDSYFEWENDFSYDIFKEAVYHSVKWWKKIRSILALEFYILFSWKKFSEIKYWDDILNYCIWIELLHSYSLVHDDLPCMDNDDFRRGELTTWKKYNDTNATLVWDLLNSMAGEIVWKINNKKLTSYFWEAIWIKWMLWWQVLDIFYEKNPWKLTLEYLKKTHNRKTWALIDSAIVWWILIADEDFNLRTDFQKINSLNDFLENYWDFGFDLWLAFQIKDDLLNVEWTFKELGKPVWTDEKKWFIYFMWAEKTREYLNETIDSCFKLSEKLNSEKIDFIIKYIAVRTK